MKSHFHKLTDESSKGSKTKFCIITRYVWSFLLPPAPDLKDCVFPWSLVALIHHGCYHTAKSGISILFSHACWVSSAPPPIQHLHKRNILAYINVHIKYIRVFQPFDPDESFRNEREWIPPQLMGGKPICIWYDICVLYIELHTQPRWRKKSGKKNKEKG